MELESGFMSSTVKVLNGSETELASGSKNVTLPSLSDGSYSISVSLIVLNLKHEGSLTCDWASLFFASILAENLENEKKNGIFACE